MLDSSANSGHRDGTAVVSPAFHVGFKYVKLGEPFLLDTLTTVLLLLQDLDRTSSATSDMEALTQSATETCLDSLRTAVAAASSSCQQAASCFLTTLGSALCSLKPPEVDAEDIFTIPYSKDPAITSGVLYCQPVLAAITRESSTIMGPSKQPCLVPGSTWEVVVYIPPIDPGLQVAGSDINA